VENFFRQIVVEKMIAVRYEVIFNAIEEDFGKEYKVCLCWKLKEFVNLIF
jgi:hypothetical protein